MRKWKLGWAIVEASTGDLVLVDGRLPVYWLRRVAQAEAKEHGFTTSGTHRDVRVQRVSIQAAR